MRETNFMMSLYDIKMVHEGMSSSVVIISISILMSTLCVQFFILKWPRRYSKP